MSSRQLDASVLPRARGVPPRLAAPLQVLAPVSRIDGAYGDRNVVCSCPPLDSYR